MTKTSKRTSRWRVHPVRFTALLITSAVALIFAAMSLAQASMRGNGGAIIYSTNHLDQVPAAPVAIVFGAGYSTSGLSPVLQDRVHTGVLLYKMGRVPKLLMTGDNGHLGYNEPDAMKAEAMREGVPAGDIYCDYAGFHTYDSLYRARAIFGVRRAILVTQTYHLHRALYTGRKLGLDVVGVSADRQVYPDQLLYDRREMISDLFGWIDVNVTRPKPKYLGPVVANLGS